MLGPMREVLRVLAIVLAGVAFVLALGWAVLHYGGSPAL